MSKVTAIVNSKAKGETVLTCFYGGTPHYTAILTESELRNLKLDLISCETEINEPSLTSFERLERLEKNFQTLCNQLRARFGEPFQ